MEPDKDSDQYPAAEMVGYSYESWRTWIAWRKAARVRLEADELVVRIEGATPYHIALGSIRGVQLHRPFRPGQTVLYSFTLALDGARRFRIESPRCIGFSLFGLWRWRDPSGTYARFVRSLHLALLARREQIAFYTCGVPWWFEWTGLIALPCVIWLFLATKGDLLLLGVGGLALGHLALNLWPVRYEPDDIPARFLPMESGPQPPSESPLR